MEYRDFEYVLTIYQEKSLSKAAEKLYITQPALSIFLTRLETQLQTRLFERTKRGLVPTYAGQKYIEFARQSIALGRSFDQELCEIQAERKGILRLGTSPHIGSIVLPEVLFSFQNRYPNIQLAITEGTSLTLEMLIDNNELDLALMHLPLLCEHAVYTRVSDDRYVMAIAKDNPLTRKAYSKPGFAHLFLDQRWPQSSSSSSPTLSSASGRSPTASSAMQASCRRSGWRPAASRAPSALHPTTSASPLRQKAISPFQCTERTRLFLSGR